MSIVSQEEKKIAPWKKDDLNPALLKRTHGRENGPKTLYLKT